MSLTDLLQHTCSMEVFPPIVLVAVGRGQCPLKPCHPTAALGARRHRHLLMGQAQAQAQALVGQLLRSDLLGWCGGREAGPASDGGMCSHAPPPSHNGPQSLGPRRESAAGFSALPMGFLMTNALSAWKSVIRAPAPTTIFSCQRPCRICV